MRSLSCTKVSSKSTPNVALDFDKPNPLPLPVMSSTHESNGFSGECYSREVGRIVEDGLEEVTQGSDFRARLSTSTSG